MKRKPKLYFEVGATYVVTDSSGHTRQMRCVKRGTYRGEAAYFLEPVKKRRRRKVK